MMKVLVIMGMKYFLLNANSLEFLLMDEGSKDQMQPLDFEQAYFIMNSYLFIPTDGNDRMARLWHTAILAKWNPILKVAQHSSLL